MELLIRERVDEYNINTVNRDLKYNFSNIRLYYYHNNIIYLKAQYNLLLGNKNVLCTLLYRRLCRCYKKESYDIYIQYRKDIKQSSYIFNSINMECYSMSQLNKNIKIMPLAYYDIIHPIYNCYYDSDSDSDSDIDYNSDYTDYEYDYNTDDMFNIYGF